LIIHRILDYEHEDGGRVGKDAGCVVSTEKEYKNTKKIEPKQRSSRNLQSLIVLRPKRLEETQQVLLIFENLN
jgi:hypothetical protein